MPKTTKVSKTLGVPVFQNPRFVEAYRQYLIHETEWAVRENIIKGFQTVNLDLIPYRLQTLDDILRFQKEVVDALLDGDIRFTDHKFVQNVPLETVEEYRKLDKTLHSAATGSATGSASGYSTARTASSNAN